MGGVRYWPYIMVRTAFIRSSDCLQPIALHTYCSILHQAHDTNTAFVVMSCSSLPQEMPCGICSVRLAERIQITKYLFPCMDCASTLSSWQQVQKCTATATRACAINLLPTGETVQPDRWSAGRIPPECQQNLYVWVPGPFHTPQL
jgi:hypothetical protein